MNAKLTWKFLEKGCAMGFEISARTQRGRVRLGLMVNSVPRQSRPSRSNTGFNDWMQIQLEIRVYLGFALKILSWNTCHWSVINSTGASPEVETADSARDSTGESDREPLSPRETRWRRPQRPDGEFPSIDNISVRTDGGAVVCANLGNLQEVIRGGPGPPGRLLLTHNNIRQYGVASSDPEQLSIGDSRR